MLSKTPHIRGSTQSSLHGAWFEVGGAEEVALGKTARDHASPGQQRLAIKHPPIDDHNRLLSHEDRCDNWPQALDDATVVFYEAARKRGLVPNFKRGKTEAMFFPHGKGSKRQAAEFYADGCAPQKITKYDMQIHPTRQC
eukprot:6240455-Pyramimonas_sp.AAC.1